MKVAMIMGSNSDWPKLESAEKVLKDFGVELEVTVASAHRTPELVKEFAEGARDRGVDVIISAAGAAAHLGGFVAAYTTLPVIGVPINATALNGMDSLLSTVQMPSGIPVATMAIDGAKNAAIFAVEIMALKYPELVQKLADYRQNMKAEVRAKGEALAAVRETSQKLDETGKKIGDAVRNFMK
jgi:5-(carboxyamino)imidazole ribonucleotide mutase